MAIDSLETMLIEELKDVYDAEKRLTKALPKMVKAAESDELREAITSHLEETKNQVTRIEQVFRLIDVKAQSKPCAGIKGIIEEGEEAIDEKADDPFGDLALIGAARRTEHYEIAAYRGLIAVAQSIGEQEVQDLLEQNLQEEEEADRKLGEIGENLIQQVGSAEDMEEDEDLDKEIAQTVRRPAARRR